MNADPNGKRPIIVKRHAAHEEDHGGQWKVAYADFVTAMMAFFLIMWLLSSTTQAERSGIAKYFSTTSLFDLKADNGVLNGGRSVMNGAEARLEQLTPRSQNTKPRDHQEDGEAKPVKAAEQARDRVERQRFEALKAEIERQVRQGDLRGLANNLGIEMTPEGLRIQIFDRDGAPMFAAGDTTPTPRLVAILGVISQVLMTVQNAVVLTGHTDGQAMQRAAYSNWELSADRANAARRQLEADGLPTTRIVGVEGRAATDPLRPGSALAPQNRRIAVTILRGDVEAARRSARNATTETSP